MSAFCSIANASSVRYRNPDLPNAAASVDLPRPDAARKAMALDPDDRYGTAEEYRDTLLEAAAGLKGGTQKDLSTVMNKLFAKEREAIAATIAKTISTKDPFNDLFLDMFFVSFVRHLFHSNCHKLANLRL